MIPSRQLGWMALAMWLVAGLTAPSSSAGAPEGVEGIGEVQRLRAAGEPAKALERLQRLPAGVQGASESRLLQGVLLADLGRDPEAEAIFLQLIREQPEAPEPYNNLAALYARAGEHEKAIEVLKRAIRTDVRYETAYENLTRLYGRLAGEAYERALGRGSEADRGAVELELLETMRSGTRAASPLPSPTSQVASGGSEQAIAGPSAPEPAPAGEAGGSEAIGAARVAPSAPDPGSLWPTVEAWAAAWAGQQVDRYLSYYDQSFQPPGGLSRGAWERLRRERLTAPARIDISLAFLDREQIGPSRWAVRFIQSYTSDTFSDVVTKRLELAGTAEGWRIAAESVVETIE